MKRSLLTAMVMVCSGLEVHADEFSERVDAIFQI